LRGWTGQAAQDLAELSQTATAALDRGGGQGEHLRQRISCDCDGHDSQQAAWTGQWPNQATNDQFKAASR